RTSTSQLRNAAPTRGPDDRAGRLGRRPPPLPLSAAPAAAPAEILDSALAASVDAQAERLRRQRSIRQQLAHYRHAKPSWAATGGSRAECQARQEEMAALAAKLDAMHRQAAAITPLNSASQPPQQQQPHQRQNSRPLPPLPPLPPAPQPAAQQQQQPPPAPSLQRRRPLPQAPPSPPPSHRRHVPPVPVAAAAASAAASAAVTSASSASSTELLLSRDRLDDLIRREATAAPNQRDSLVVQDPADEVEAAEAKAEAEAAAAAAAEKSHSESKAPEQPPGSETDSSGEEDPACLTEEPPPPPGERRRRPDDPRRRPTGGWMAPIAKLDDEDDLSLSDYDEAAPVAKGKSSGAPPPTVVNGKKKKKNKSSNNDAGNNAGKSGSDGDGDQVDGSGQQRSVTFDPLTLLLDAAIQGDLAPGPALHRPARDPSAANSEGPSAPCTTPSAPGTPVCVQYLIDSGTDVNAADQDGWTPLHCAVTCDSLPLTKLLVGSGAVLYCTTHSDSETPFDLCHNGGPVEAWAPRRGGPPWRRQFRRVFAAFDYSPEQADELALARGDQLTVACAKETAPRPPGGGAGETADADARQRRRRTRGGLRGEKFCQPVQKSRLGVLLRIL
uniref:ANK_REP_REGION domain-containing protein n=1 Tax=Macrostomum lignano TaxID=282301 RepID=A0A1I8FFS6_9PLAT